MRDLTQHLKYTKHAKHQGSQNINHLPGVSELVNDAMGFKIRSLTTKT